MSGTDQPLVFVDLETTGATAGADRITEIGIVEVSASGVAEWSTLVNPEAPIPPFIARLTGIDDAMVAAAPRFGEIASEVLERLQGRLFVAHNARFDYGFLKSEFKRAGIEFRADVLCTVKFSRKLFPEHHKHSLDALVERHGLAVETRHRALADARAIHAFWNRVHADMPGEAIRAVLDELLQTPKLPPGLDPAVLDDQPEGCGVYVLYRADGQALYVGKSNNLRRGVLAHFLPGSTKKKTAFAAEVHRIDWIETAGELGAALTEARLAETLHPLHNRTAARGAEACAWKLETAANGAMTVRLADAAEPGFGTGDDFFGPFPSRKKALETLRKLAPLHSLCLIQLGLEPPGGPCSAYPKHECRGLCLARETPGQHDIRLITALARIQLPPWPYPGPIGIREAAQSWGGTPEIHVVDRWRCLGSAKTEQEVAELLRGEGRFDIAAYHILSRFLGQGRGDVVVLGGRRGGSEREFAAE